MVMCFVCTYFGIILYFILLCACVWSHVSMSNKITLELTELEGVTSIVRLLPFATGGGVCLFRRHDEEGQSRLSSSSQHLAQSFTTRGNVSFIKVLEHCHCC